VLNEADDEKGDKTDQEMSPDMIISVDKNRPGIKI